MDPEVFIKLSIGSLGLRLAGVELKTENSGINELSLPYVCEIRLRGFPVKTLAVPLMSSADIIPYIQNNASSFYLGESDLQALLAPGCFYKSHACLEISVFTEAKEANCVGIKRQQIGIFRMQVGPEWGERKPMVLFNGWTSIGKNKQETEKLGAELHLRVKVDPDPRYVFQFEDIITLSPQIVQQQGSFKQPIFSCKFSKDR